MTLSEYKSKNVEIIEKTKKMEDKPVKENKERDREHAERFDGFE